MRAATIVTTLLAFGALIACGGAQSASGSEGSGYSTCTDFGLDEAQLQECEAVEVDCPGAVGMMETDPPQFGCTNRTSGPGASDSVSPPGAESCEGYSVGDSCVDEAAFAQCQEMAARCPGEVQALESCPLQFACP